MNMKSEHGAPPSPLESSYDIDGLVQDCSLSITLEMEILQSCTEPSIWLNSAESWQVHDMEIISIFIGPFINGILSQQRFNYVEL